MVILSLRFNEDNRFQTTPLDYLMVFLAVTFPLLPEVSADISHLGIFAAKLMVLFFLRIAAPRIFQPCQTVGTRFALDSFRTRNSDFVVAKRVT